ncbi:MAG: DNA translocase FtsK [Bacillota bacterium]|nr:DNA translocase FtsK [Bacillota bacterium]
MAKKRKKKLNKEMRSQIKGVLVIALGVFSYFGLVETAQTGGLGLFLNSLLRTIAGDVAIIIPFFIIVSGIRIILPREKHTLKVRLAGLLILFVLYAVWIHLDLMSSQVAVIAEERFIRDSFLLGLNRQGGGAVGAAFAVLFYFLLGFTGSRIILGALSFIALLLVLNISLNKFFKAVFKLLNSIIELFKSFVLYIAALTGKIFANWQKRKQQALLRKEAESQSTEKEELLSETGESDTLSQSGPVIISGGVNNGGTDKGNEPAAMGEYQQERHPIQIEQNGEEGTDSEKLKPSIVTTGRSNTEYKFPPLELLDKQSDNREHNYRKSSNERAKLLENTLQSFGVRARVIHVQSGPTVTRFEVQPEAGVKVSKIISLSDDLALNLAAPLVRIEAPIPGKAALGIEVPNKVVSLVYLREVMEESAYRQSNSPLTVGLGKDITGVPVIADLTKMPHLLIAGATGAGKSVCLNTLINSILFKASPDQVRFMMIDPKVVELSVYNGIPHLLMPVLTDPRKASLALRNMVREMSRRYDLFASIGVRDIGAYNELTTEEEELEKLPFIVVLIDELADLMLVSPGEVEDAIARLAQMSRAAGIHLIVATQRPSVDVLTGIIKANITSRIAFTVSSQFDSRTILDMAGAEKLLGRGDMLFYPVGAVKPFRVQGAYVSEAEVKRVTDFIKEQGMVDYEKGPSFLDAPEESEEEEADALFGDAIDLVVRTGQASISLLQRRFRIGYTRAARLIDDLERRGIVGPFEGSKPREVLITQEQAAKICEDFNSKNK